MLIFINHCFLISLKAKKPQPTNHLLETCDLLYCVIPHCWSRCQIQRQGHISSRFASKRLFYIVLLFDNLLGPSGLAYSLYSSLLGTMALDSAQSAIAAAGTDCLMTPPARWVQLHAPKGAVWEMSALAILSSKVRRSLGRCLVRGKRAKLLPQGGAGRETWEATHVPLAQSLLISLLHLRLTAERAFMYFPL